MISTTTRRHTPTNEFELFLDIEHLYPPYIGSGTAGAGATARVPEGMTVEFELTLNGEAGEFPGMTFRTIGTNIALIGITQDFILNYTGAWPVSAQVNARLEDGRTARAVLWLHDTRVMLPARIDVQFDPNPAWISRETNRLFPGVRTYDGNGIELPANELSWALDLVRAVEGVWADGDSILMTAAAKPGPVDVRVKLTSGLEQLATLVLVEKNVDVTLQRSDLYPPNLADREVVLSISADLPAHEDAEWFCTFNDERIYPAGFFYSFNEPSEGFCMIEAAFLHNWQGAWPVDVKFHVTQQGLVVGASTLRLHDTRTMKPHSVVLEMRPSAEVTIPAEAEEMVFAVGVFRDAAGVLLPLDELVTVVRLLEPVDGVIQYNRIFLVTPEASPGQIKVFIHESSGLEAMAVLTLL